MNTLFATAVILGGLSAATFVFAEESAPAPSGHGMMGPMTMMGQMSPDQMKQMTEMVDRCDRMMAHLTSAPKGPAKEQPPASHN
jgi:hypothetical protein